MFNRKLKLVTLVLAMVLILSQGVVLAENAEGFAVEIVGEGVETELKLSLADLKAMPEEAQINEEYIYNSKGGEKSALVKGVSLAYVLKEKAGVTAENAEVLFEASDGYPIDPQTLEDIFNEDLKFVLAYEINGEVIDNDDDPDNEEIVIYRKLKEPGEFGTVYKMVVKITVGEAIEATEDEKPVEEEPKPEEVKDIVFTDITAEYEFAARAIDELAKKGIIDGIGNNKYAPEKEFTRAQFCKIMVEALGYDKVEYTGEFTDVKAEDWFAPYVQAAINNGLFTGYTDGTFRPDQPIIRQEIAAVAGRAAVIAEIVPQAKMDKFVMEKSNFADKDLIPDWAENEVAWLEAQGVFENVATDNFEPEKIVNRAEAAVIVYNALFQE
ncbi:S-layer homology domain-containing protein [Clostridium sp. Cult2]|uniref:S-layer homology domain-containing protein n=1 Tax=Clostridium sp. Cult2 TaxID=2079003 RepID=UPI001F45FECD|nr:S-layer homology domain-containing protein [Clostridium sp. Cult2]MCF6465515.1 hypothetical protein [Clostridium sp. Cult2]